MENHKKPWFIKKLKQVANISIDAGKAAAEATWPASSLILERAKEECYKIACESQFYDAAVNSCCTSANETTLHIKGLDVVDSGLVIEVINGETKQR